MPYTWYRVKFVGGGSMHAWAQDEQEARKKASKYNKNIESIELMSKMKSKPNFDDF